MTTPPLPPPTYPEHAKHGISKSGEDIKIVIRPSLYTADQVHQARADLEAENKRLREALKAILQSWDNNTFDRERFVKSEIGDYWSPASAMVNSETIAAARAALEKQP